MDSPKADMSNVVNLTVAQLTNNIYIAEQLMQLFKDDEQVYRELALQHKALADELDKRDTPTVIELNTLKISAERH